MTNFEWIECLDQGGLAEFIMSSDIPWCYGECPWYKDVNHHCEDCVVIWLNKEREV